MAEPHYTRDQLLAWMDRELSLDTTHIEQCEVCQRSLAELRQDHANYEQWHEEWKQSTPTPPRPWKTFEELATSRQPAVMPQPQSHARWRLVALAAACVFTLFVGFNVLVTPTRLSAADILMKAQKASATRQKPRSAKAWNRNGKRMSLQPQEEQRLRKLFANARLDWDHPLDAARFAAWREGLAAKSDAVDRTSDGFAVSTITPEGELARATLEVRDEDWAPVRGRFQFRSFDWLEVYEVAEAPLPDAVVPQRAQKREATIEINPTEDPRLELQVVAALHAIGADLGEPIEIKRDGAGIELAVMGLPPARAQAIADAMKPLSGVRLAANEASIPQPTLRGTTPRIPSPSDKPAAWEEKVAGRFQPEEYSQLLLGTTGAALARAYSLRALAVRFPTEREQLLAIPEREMLLSIRKDHLNELARQLARLASLVALLDSTTTSAPKVAPLADWRERANQIHQTALELDQRISEMFAPDPGRTPTDLPQLVEALRQLVEQKP